MEYVNPPCNLLPGHFHTLLLSAPSAALTSISGRHSTITICRGDASTRRRLRREMDALEKVREGELHLFLEWGRRLGNRDIPLKKKTPSGRILGVAVSKSALIWVRANHNIPIRVLPPPHPELGP